jgi:hypothetical protein
LSLCLGTTRGALEGNFEHIGGGQLLNLLYFHYGIALGARYDGRRLIAAELVTEGHVCVSESDSAGLPLPTLGEGRRAFPRWMTAGPALAAGFLWGVI